MLAAAFLVFQTEVGIMGEHPYPVVRLVRIPGVPRFLQESLATLVPVRRVSTYSPVCQYSNSPGGRPALDGRCDSHGDIYTCGTHQDQPVPTL